MMDWGLTVPKDFVRYFDPRKGVKLGSQKEINITWDKRKYKVKLCNVNRKYGGVYQIRWDSNKDFLKKLRKTFIQSYVILKSQKELFELSKSRVRKHFRTAFSGGQQEVLIFQPVGRWSVECEVFIKIESEWNHLFERLADQNVFGWLFEKNRSYLVARSAPWFDVKDFKKHTEAANVIYYLASTKRKLLYIGKAEVLGKRVKPGRAHQGMPGDWDKFRYDILYPKYADILEKVEDHTIRAFASVLKNGKLFSSLNESKYRLVNKNWRKL